MDFLDYFNRSSQTKFCNQNFNPMLSQPNLELVLKPNSLSLQGFKKTYLRYKDLETKWMEKCLRAKSIGQSNLRQQRAVD